MVVKGEVARKRVRTLRKGRWHFKKYEEFKDVFRDALQVNLGVEVNLQSSREYRVEQVSRECQRGEGCQRSGLHVHDLCEVEKIVGVNVREVW